MKIEKGVVWRLAAAVLLMMASLLPACSPGAPIGTDGSSNDTVKIVFMGFVAGGSMQMRSDAMAEAVRLEHPEWQVTSFAPGGRGAASGGADRWRGGFLPPPCIQTA